MVISTAVNASREGALYRDTSDPSLKMMFPDHKDKLNIIFAAWTFWKESVSEIYSHLVRQIHKQWVRVRVRVTSYKMMYLSNPEEAFQIDICWFVFCHYPQKIKLKYYIISLSILPPHIYHIWKYFTYSAVERTFFPSSWYVMFCIIILFAYYH